MVGVIGNQSPDHNRKQDVLGSSHCWRCVVSGVASQLSCCFFILTQSVHVIESGMSKLVAHLARGRRPVSSFSCLTSLRSFPAGTVMWFLTLNIKPCVPCLWVAVKRLPFPVPRVGSDIVTLCIWGKIPPSPWPHGSLWLHYSILLTWDISPWHLEALCQKRRISAMRFSMWIWRRLFAFNLWRFCEAFWDPSG